MGSEIIVLVVPFGMLCIAYFIFRLCPPGKRFLATLVTSVVLAASYWFIVRANGSIGTFAVVLGVLLVVAAVMHVVGSGVGAGIKKLCSLNPRA
jgi:ABC-type multidrug transport system permease subunit